MKIENFFANASTKFYLAFFVGYFFLRNVFMPLCYDDYCYSFVWDGEHGGNLDAMEGGERQRVQSFGDIIQSQFSHYMTWGGRVFGHSLAQFFLWTGKFSFDVANTIVLIIFVLTVLKLAKINFRDGKFAVIWIFTNLFFFGAAFGGTVIWMTWLTGACNYFWMTVFQLIFFLPYVKALRAEKISLNPLLVALGGLIAGWAMEAGSLATVFLTAIFVLIARKKKILQTWMLAGLFGVIIGCVLDISAPGNFAQLKFIQSVNPDFYTFSAKLFAYHIFHAFLQIIIMDLFALMPMIIYFCRRGFYKLNTNEILMTAFAAAGFLVPCAMLFSPKFELRVTVISMIFVLVASTMALAEMKKFEFTSKKICAGLMIILLLYFASSIYENFLVERETSRQLKIISEHKQDDLIVLPEYKLSSILRKIHREDRVPLHSFGGLMKDENYCMNVMAAKYYGVKKISAVNADVD